MESKNYKHYITGLKGFACVLIMVGHYLGLYKYAQQFSSRLSLLDTFMGSQLSFLLSEGYWLYLFFVVSGYLIAKSNVKKIGDVVYKTITRFLRLAFPIFFAYAIIYLIYILVGFHNAETSSLFRCDWYQSYYSGSYSVMDVLHGPTDVLIRGIRALNAPYWVLKDMFIASILIYILKYFYNILGEKNDAVRIWVMTLITFTSSFASTKIAACLMGMLVCVYEDRAEVYKKPYFAFWVMAVAMVLYILPKNLVASFFFASLIIFIPKVKCIDRVFSSKPFQFLGKISWGVYSFHWPLICSIGGMLMIYLQPKVGLLKSYFIACVLTSIGTLIISIIFYFTFERFSAFLLSRIDMLLRRFMCSDRRKQRIEG